MKPLSWNQDTLLMVSGSYWMTCTLHAGVKLGVFSLLGGGGKTAGEMAAAAGADPGGLERLLNALTAMGLLRKTDGIFTNMPEAEKYLVKDSPDYLGHIIQHHRHLVALWSKLDQSVVSGQPVSGVQMDKDFWEYFQLGMFNNAMLLAPELVRSIDLSGRKRLLDLGGGPGTYAIQFCRHNPDLSAMVFDLPDSEPFFRKTAERFGLRERVAFTGGNFMEDDLSGPYDVVWLSHILHAESPEGCGKIIKRAVSVLSPGGLLLIHDFILKETGDGPLFPALFSLNMLLGTPGGKTYTQNEIKKMLENAGAGNIRRLDYSGGFAESGIMAAIV